MHPNKGYHLTMRQPIAVAAVVAAMALLAPVSRAQVRGIPAPDSDHTTGRSSVVPPRHAGVMPTPIGVSPPPAPGFPTPAPIGVPPQLPAPGSHNSGQGFHGDRDHDHDFRGGFYPVYVPVPVVVEPDPAYDSAPNQEEEDDQSVVPGPTVFERRTPYDMTAASGSSTANPAPDTEPAPPVDIQPAPAARAPAVQDQSGAAGQPSQPQPESVLVFRDGHQLEVQNYAIVGDTLFDFTPGHARKVPLSLLDLNATVKANDDRGLDFALPASVKSD